MNLPRSRTVAPLAPAPALPLPLSAQAAQPQGLMAGFRPGAAPPPPPRLARGTRRHPETSPA